jgi:hypothetical protein
MPNFLRKTTPWSYLLAGSITVFLMGVLLIDQTGYFQQVIVERNLIFPDKTKAVPTLVGQMYSYGALLSFAFAIFWINACLNLTVRNEVETERRSSKHHQDPQQVRMGGKVSEAKTEGH